MTPILTPSSQAAYTEIIAGLGSLGYRGPLLVERYRWKSPDRIERQVAAAAFGQTPVSYASALIGVVQANGITGTGLIDNCLALGAPFILEIGADGVDEWAVSREPGHHAVIEHYALSDIQRLIFKRSLHWDPDRFLRDKNIGSFPWLQQPDLFSGLIPELEGQIQEQMEPLLHQALSLTREAYRTQVGRDPNPAHLFKLIFWLLTAKVFRDRDVSGFRQLESSSDPDDMLSAVAKHYGNPTPQLLNRRSRRAAASRIWEDLDFRNLSVEILSQIWSTALVDSKTRKRLGIHRTPRSIVRYILERFPFTQSGDDPRIVLEPCCGSGVFLIGAMNRLRRAQFGTTPKERHRYFVKHLAGVEKDAFGIEIARLALTLADFPNSDGWDIRTADVFEDGVLSELLGKAGVVLCNPPFETFDPESRDRYSLTSVKKPAELLERVLNDLHPEGVLGFVLPRNFIDGGGYANVRFRLAKRFRSIELVILPDRAFQADQEICLLIATEPRPHEMCRVLNRTVKDSREAWKRFDLLNEVSSERTANQNPRQSRVSFSVPELQSLWDHLRTHDTLGDIASLRRGIEWNLPLTRAGKETGSRDVLILDHSRHGYSRGVPPRSAFSAFEIPSSRFLCMIPEKQRGSPYKLPWDRHKVILNKTTRSRGRWRIAAFPDTEGLVCYQTYIGIWPERHPDDLWLISAILNSPLANAFVATREGKTDITLATLKAIPVPFCSSQTIEKIGTLIRRYQAMLHRHSLHTAYELSSALMKIDAAVLDAYQLTPELEHGLLNWFEDDRRTTAHEFTGYPASGQKSYFALSDYLSPQFARATPKRLLEILGAAKR